MTFRRLALLLVPAALVVATVAGCSSSGGGSSASAPAPIATATQTVTSAAPPSGSGVAASSAAGGGGSASSSASGPGLCTPTVMTFSIGPRDGAAGTSFFTVTATNGSQSPCVTTGFPGVAFLDGSGKQFAQASRDSTVQTTTLTVAPGASVNSRLAVGDVGTGGAACPSSSAFLFTLPDNTDSTKLTVPALTVCDARVQAFTAGS